MCVCGWQLVFIAADLPGSDGVLALNSNRHSSASVACEVDAYKHWIVRRAETPQFVLGPYSTTASRHSQE